MLRSFSSVLRREQSTYTDQQFAVCPTTRGSPERSRHLWYSERFETRLEVIYLRNNGPQRLLWYQRQCFAKSLGFVCIHILTLRQTYVWYSTPVWWYAHIRMLTFSQSCVIIHIYTTRHTQNGTYLLTHTLQHVYHTIDKLIVTNTHTHTKIHTIWKVFT